MPSQYIVLIVKKAELIIQRKKRKKKIKIPEYEFNIPLIGNLDVLWDFRVACF